MVLILGCFHCAARKRKRSTAGEEGYKCNAAKQSYELHSPLLYKIVKFAQVNRGDGADDFQSLSVFGSSATGAGKDELFELGYPTRDA